MGIVSPPTQTIRTHDHVWVVSQTGLVLGHLFSRDVQTINIIFSGNSTLTIIQDITHSNNIHPHPTCSIICKMEEIAGSVQWVLPDLVPTRNAVSKTPTISRLCPHLPVEEAATALTEVQPRPTMTELFPIICWSLSHRGQINLINQSASFRVWEGAMGVVHLHKPIHPPLVDKQTVIPNIHPIHQIPQAQVDRMTVITYQAPPPARPSPPFAPSQDLACLVLELI